MVKKQLVSPWSIGVWCGGTKREKVLQKVAFPQKKNDSKCCKEFSKASKNVLRKRIVSRLGSRCFHVSAVICKLHSCSLRSSHVRFPVFTRLFWQKDSTFLPILHEFFSPSKCNLLMHNQFPCVKNNGSFWRTTRSAKKNRFSRGNAHAKNLTRIKELSLDARNKNIHHSLWWYNYFIN